MSPATQLAASAVHAPPARQRLGSGFGLAIGLHAAVFAGIIAAALFQPRHRNPFGDSVTRQGAVQATMVNSLPLPQRVPPVDKQVLAPEHVSPAPKPPPKEAAAPPPRPTDILVKAKTPEKVPPKKAAPIETPAPPKHPQPTPPTPKATTGESATQFAQSATQVRNGTAAATVEDRAFGARYAYYRDVISRTVAQNWFTGEADPAASNGKTTTLVFDVERDGTIANIRTEKRSGSPSLDSSALRALQRVDSFGPLPGPADHVTVEYSFEFRQP